MSFRLFRSVLAGALTLVAFWFACIAVKYMFVDTIGPLVYLFFAIVLLVIASFAWRIGRPNN
jgi:hypothetical protein